LNGDGNFSGVNEYSMLISAYEYIGTAGNEQLNVVTIYESEGTRVYTFDRDPGSGDLREVVEVFTVTGGSEATTISMYYYKDVDGRIELDYVRFGSMLSCYVYDESGNIKYVYQVRDIDQDGQLDFYDQNGDGVFNPDDEDLLFEDVNGDGVYNPDDGDVLLEQTKNIIYYADGTIDRIESYYVDGSTRSISTYYYEPPEVLDDMPDLRGFDWDTFDWNSDDDTLDLVIQSEGAVVENVEAAMIYDDT